MSDFDDILKNYVEHILHIQAEKNQETLSQEELNEVATRLGLTQADLIYIEKRFTAYYTRGIGFAKYNNWDKAIQELEQACKIKPISSEALYRLADAYRNRFLKKGRKEDKILAEKYAQRCLQIEYKHEKAIELISQINRLKPKNKKKTWLKYSLIIILILSVLTLAFFMIQDFLKPQPNKVSEEKNEQDKPQPLIEEKNNLEEVPIFLDDEGKIFGLDLDVETSILKKENDTFHYQYKGSLLNKKYELSELVFTVVVLNDKNEAIHEENLNILDTKNAELKPDDVLPFSFSLHQEFGTKKIKGIRLDIYNIENVELEEPYLAKDTLLTYFKPSQNPDLMLEVRERSQTIIPNTESFDHEIILEYQNVGKAPIKQLELEIEWYNKSFNLIYNSVVDLVKSDEPILKPSQRRRWKKEFVINLKNSQYRYYKVKVLRIK